MSAKVQARASTSHPAGGWCWAGPEPPSTSPVRRTRARPSRPPQWYAARPRTMTPIPISKALVSPTASGAGSSGSTAAANARSCCAATDPEDVVHHEGRHVVAFPVRHTCGSDEPGQVSAAGERQPAPRHTPARRHRPRRAPGRSPRGSRAPARPEPPPVDGRPWARAPRRAARRRPRRAAPACWRRASRGRRARTPSSRASRRIERSPRP